MDEMLALRRAGLTTDQLISRVSEPHRFSP